MRLDTGLTDRYTAVAAATVAKNAETHYRNGTLDIESWRELAAEGLWRLAVPRRFGGYGGGWWDFVAAFEGIAAGGQDLGFNLSLVAQAGLIRSMLTFCTEEQIGRYLPILLDGGVGATALTETRGGSDVARVQTAAVRTADGYVLTGAKDHVTHGPIADLAFVLARVPELGRRDITLFIVDMNDPDVHKGEIENMAGNRTSPTGPFTLDGVALGHDSVVGSPGDGLTMIYNTISLDRLLYGVLAAGYLEPVLADAFSFSEQREAFKHKIIDYQYVQARLTDMRMSIDTTRAISYTALDALLDERPEANRLCSTAKFHGAESLRAGAEHALRIKGHLGYMAGPTIQRLLDAYGCLIAGGTAEMQRKNIFNQMRTGASAAPRALAGQTQ
ncbi:acyl-CoA dehydrogenase family protein [Nocardia sp. NPDC003482]